MSDPQQTPTPEETPAKGKKRPSGPERSNSELSNTSQDDPGYESRSRSQSRRRRRQNQRQRQAQSKAQAGNAKAESMAKIDEQEEPQQQQEPDKSQWLTSPATQDTTEAQPFERIKPPSQSMDGPVTYARMMRGEIPMRGKPPSQPYDTTQGVEAKTQPDPMDQEGLKLRIELNIDIEIELKASIHGDLTLALL